MSAERKPGHMRSAHFHRVRVATRDSQGRIVGSPQGKAGIDLHYELRRYPPIPVNVRPDGPQPVVRDLQN